MWLPRFCIGLFVLSEPSFCRLVSRGTTACAWSVSGEYFPSVCLFLSSSAGEASEVVRRCVLCG